MAPTPPPNPLVRRILLAVALIIILLLTVFATIIVHAAQSFDIPLPASLKAATLASPILQLLGALSTRPIAKNFKFLSRLLPILTSLTLAIDVGLVAAGTTRLDETLLECALSSQWLQWYMAKDAGPVRQIQDALTCCGLQSAHDMAWPFPDRSHSASACETAYGRHQGCMTLWQGQARHVLSGLIGIGTTGIVFKVILLLLAWRLSFDLHMGGTNDVRGRTAPAAGQDRGHRDLLTGRVEEEEEDNDEEHARGALVATSRYADE